MTLETLKLQRTNASLQIKILEQASQINELVAENLARSGRMLDQAIAQMEAAEKAAADAAEKAAEDERAGEVISLPVDEE